MKHPARDCPPPCEDTLVTLLVRVPPARIGLVVAIFEAYEGIAIVRTRDAALGLLELWVMPGQRATAEGALDDLRRRFRIDFLEERPGHPSLASSPKA